jgi:broad specificity phosphatase PhoE
VRRPTIRALAALCGLALLAGPAVAGDAVANSPVVFLVRHAETAPDGTADPPLSALGRARAEALAEHLAAAGIERILASTLRRTGETAAPLAARLGLEVELYDPHDLPAAATAVTTRNVTTLVVGHSNTTPELAGLLGGEPGAPIAEDEHDRIYRLDLAAGTTEGGRLPEPVVAP